MKDGKLITSSELVHECLLHLNPNCGAVCLCKACFPLQPYRSETYRIPLFCEHSGRTNDMDTKEYPTFCYNTVGMGNGLKPLRKSYPLLYCLCLCR